MGEIVLKNIEMTLDPDSIQRAIEEVEDLNNNLKQALDALCEWLLKQGVTIARMKLRGYFAKGSGASRGNLIRSIRYEMANGTSGEGYLMAGYPNDHMSDNPKWANISYAVFFEFGFGTGSYYDSRDGSLIKTNSALERRRRFGMASRGTGRTRKHPLRETYRDMETYDIQGGGKHSGKPEFFGWVYKDRMTGKFYVSHGQNPKPFMYETFLDLKDKAERDGAQQLQKFIAEYTT